MVETIHVWNREEGTARKRLSDVSFYVGPIKMRNYRRPCILPSILTVSCLNPTPKGRPGQAKWYVIILKATNVHPCLLFPSECPWCHDGCVKWPHPCFHDSQVLISLHYGSCPRAFPPELSALIRTGTLLPPRLPLPTSGLISPLLQGQQSWDKRLRISPVKLTERKITIFFFSLSI